MRQNSDGAFEAAARKSPRSLLGLAITTRSNLCAADGDSALSSVESTDCAKPLRPEENSRFSSSRHLGFTASWHAACYSKQCVIVPSTEAWARGPNRRVRGRGRTMREFAAGFRARHEKQEERQCYACRSVNRSRIHAAEKTNVCGFRRHISAPPTKARVHHSRKLIEGALPLPNNWSKRRSIVLIDADLATCMRCRKEGF